MLRAAIPAAARRRLVTLARPRWVQPKPHAGCPERQDLERSSVPLYIRLMALHHERPSGAVAAELDAWLRQRRPLSEEQIITVIRKLRKFKHNPKALELMEWMEAHGANLSHGHHALRLSLISKVHGIQAAEQCFLNLPDIFKSRKTYCCLLSCYSEHGMADKGLELYEKMKAMGIVSSTLVYNNLMVLYQKAGQLEKILSTFEEMRQSCISASEFTYYILVQCYITMNDVESAEKVLEELQKVAPVPWSLYTKMADYYIKLEQFSKAEDALKKAEEVMDKAEMSPWHHLLSLYARSGNATEVKRIWESLKSAFKKCLNRSYLVMLQALRTVDDFDSLQQVFQEWEASHQYYDRKIANIMIKAYLRKGMIDEAEAIRQSAMAQGCYSRSTVYIFANLYLDRSDVKTALEIFRNAKDMVTPGPWVPPKELVGRFLKHYEKSKDVDGMESFCECLKKFKCLDAEAYEALMRTYIAAGRTNPSIAQRVEDDGIHIEPEMAKLLKSVSGS